jgi:hypothetical protein
MAGRTIYTKQTQSCPPVADFEMTITLVITMNNKEWSRIMDYLKQSQNEPNQTQSNPL